MMRRAVVLIAVLLVTVAMAASLTAMLSGVRGQSDAVFAVVTRHEQRLAARSAAYAIAAEMGASRDRVLGGEMPGLSSSASVIRRENADGWGWSLVEREDGEPVLEAMSGRIDANHASDEVVVALLSDDSKSVLDARPLRTPGALRAVLPASKEDVDSADRTALMTLISVDPQVRSGVGGPAGSRGAADWDGIR